MTEGDVSTLDQEQRLQEDQYSFPYHYIPAWDGRRFSPVRYWAWSHHYLGGFEVAFRCLDALEFRTLVDIGCGDGRFLVEARSRYPSVEMIGVDYSERAIALAQALNPSGSYKTCDIVRDGLDRRFDMATLIEVLEHIPPELVPQFLDSVAETINPGGWLLLTVPHTNKPLQAKHYQHFSSDQLLELLAPDFESVEFLPFDRRSQFLRFVQGLLGGRGRHAIVTDHRLQTAFWRLYRARYLYTTESQCLRIAALCRRKSP